MRCGFEGREYSPKAIGLDADPRIGDLDMNQARAAEGNRDLNVSPRQKRALAAK